ncbi:MAG: hypothetical protein DME42_10035 [Verrucomicrobia bacterium]|nr:MAG: hypothetical protein DME42_10035 [Verrucomicrobiota bacterium]
MLAAAAVMSSAGETEIRGAHAPRVLRLAPSPIAGRDAKKCFGEAPKVRAGLALHARRARS